ncbi:MAG: hypothetical protein MI723_18495 [Caulobacterales bacterium]|nr:hypothetical protein [Caulobacterales bacterium]
MHTTIVRAEDIAALIAQVSLDVLMDDMTARLRDCFTRLDDANIAAPPRSGFSYRTPHFGLIEWMPAIRYDRHATVKMVGYHPRNVAAGRGPTILSTISLYETASGHLAGLADATFLTALRTAAASRVASESLARPGAATLGLIGLGAQAVAHAHALCRAFPITRLLINDIEPAATASFAARIAPVVSPEIAIRPAPPELLVQSADILCTCTSVAPGSGPVFTNTDTRPWLHANAVGSDFPGKTELPRSLVERSFVVPDFQAQAVEEGECQHLPPESIGPELAALMRDEAIGDAQREKRTVFDSTGHAVEDLAAMEMVLDYCSELGLGVGVELEAAGGDPLNPYDVAGQTRDKPQAPPPPSGGPQLTGQSPPTLREVVTRDEP